MSNLKQMLDICKTIPKAKEFAENLIKHQNIKDVWLDLSLLNATEGNYEESIDCLNQLEDYSPTRYHVIYCMGYYEMLNGNLLQGFTSMNQGRYVGLWGNKYLNTKKPFLHSDEQDIKNKTILINMEAGLGDQIVFIRFIKDLKERYNTTNIISCNKSLIPVFEKLDYIDMIIDSEQFNDSLPFDYWIPSMYLPVLLKTEFKDLNGEKYLTPNKEYTDKYKDTISQNNKKKSIGLRWLGQPGDDYITRVFPEQLMFNVFDDMKDKFNLFSLQKDFPNKKEIPNNIIDLDNEMDSWNSTMGIIENLDLVITSCTSIAHISAAMGKETWVIIPKSPYYVWISENGFTENTPWYNSVTLFQQEKYGEWQDVFDKIKKKLKEIKFKI